jgi:hypothetical protein
MKASENTSLDGVSDFNLLSQYPIAQRILALLNE